MSDDQIFSFWDLPDDLSLALDSLDFIVAAKVRSGPKGWKLHPAPEGKSLGEERWPHKVTDQAQTGDELWWFCSPQETWDKLCGRAGWALVRAGKVITIEIVVMN